MNRRRGVELRERRRQGGAAPPGNGEVRRLGELGGSSWGRGEAGLRRAGTSAGRVRRVRSVGVRRLVRLAG